ncbi:MAG: ABC transporter ATP-binding protein/permease [Clostridia bacterium]|nr:ABC transporter ATP-binding protein/permease [Clostridia bacterium]
MKNNKKKGLLKRFVRYYKPHKKLFIIDMACAFLISVFNLVYPYITKEIINNYVPNKLLYYLLAGAGLLLGLYAIKAVLNYILQYWGHLVGTRMQADMRRELFKHLQKLPFTYFDNNKTGVIMSRMTNDLFDVSELAHHGPEDVFLSLVTLIGAFVMLAFINVYLALIVFACVPFIVVVAMLLRKRQKQTFARMRVVQGEINADIESAVSGVRISRAYCAQKHEGEKFEEGNIDFVKAKSRQYKVMGEFHSSMNFLMDFLYFAVLLAGGLFFYYDKIDVGEFTAFVLYITTLITPIRTLVSIYEQIQEGASGFARFCEIMDEPCEEDSPNALVPDILRGEIEFCGVSFGYNKEDGAHTVINNFDMKINVGKTIALVGPSGGGKTTICHLIPRFYEIDAGKITVDGYDIRDLDRQALRKNIGIVQQDVFLFNGTIRENIAYGNFDAPDEEIYEAAKKANIHDYVCSLPDGYNTCVGERGVKLSGGQKQRISIARAFLKNPPILILDEATSALDNATEMQIQDALSKLSEGRTTLVVAHRLSTVKNADEIIVITSDGIEERGTHAELIKKNGAYKKLYDYQFKNL